MPSEKLKFEGTVLAPRGNGFFEVELQLGDGQVKNMICQLSGKMRSRHIKIVSGDVVDVELDTYDMSKGMIKYRKKTR